MTEDSKDYKVVVIRECDEGFTIELCAELVSDSSYPRVISKEKYAVSNFTAAITRAEDLLGGAPCSAS